jgi:hypothetical protein
LTVIHEDHPNRNRDRNPDRYREYKKFTAGCGVEPFDFDTDFDTDFDSDLDSGAWTLGVGYSILDIVLSVQAYRHLFR